MLERQAPAVTGAAFRRSSGIIPSNRKGRRFDLMTQTDGNGANGGVAARSTRDLETGKARLRAIHTGPHRGPPRRCRQDGRGRARRRLRPCHGAERLR
jgi:hypothetical protein